MDAQSVLQNFEGFLNSPALDITIKGILIYIALLWIALIVWVTKDITNRTDNIVYQVVSILLIVLGTPVFGLLIYLIIRPGKTLMDSYYESLEADVLEQEAFIAQLKIERAAKKHPEIQSHLTQLKEKSPRKPKVKSIEKNSEEASPTAPESSADSIS